MYGDDDNIGYSLQKYWTEFPFLLKTNWTDTDLQWNYTKLQFQRQVFCSERNNYAPS